MHRIEGVSFVEFEISKSETILGIECNFELSNLNEIHSNKFEK